MAKDNKHLFTVYFKTEKPFSLLSVGDVLELTDAPAQHRIKKILRLEVNDLLQIFDGDGAVLWRCTNLKNKNCQGIIEEVFSISRRPYQLQAGISILKKETMADAVYAAAAAGVTHIVPIITEKQARKWGGEQERERLEKVVIAACEQSKNFLMPLVEQPILLEDFLSRKLQLLYFDVLGKSLQETIASFCKKDSSVLIGPEAGFSKTERQKIEAFSQATTLTPTTLRALDAATVGCALASSLLFCQ